MTQTPTHDPPEAYQEVDSTTLAGSRSPAWPAIALLSFLTLVAYGAVWTRGVQGDDLCICELASTYDFSVAVQRWLDQWNGRLFHSVVQIGTYGLPWFADPFRAPWYLLHGGSVLAHTLFCCLLLHLLLRAGIGRGAALVSTTAFAVHPITAEPVLWLAESSGYVLGNLLLLLAIWAFLQHERRPGAPWAVLTVLLAVCATLTIEQYLPALCLLALAYWVWSRREGARRTPWLAVAAVFFCVLAFAVFHFGGFSGTADRLSRVHDQPPAAGEQRPSLLWTFAWWLVLAPDMGLFSGALVSGWRILLNDWRVMAAVGVAVIAATAMIASRSTWTAPRTVPARSYRFWLIIAGLLAFTGSLLPFLVTGRYGIAVRNMYVALPGLLVVCAVGLDLLTTRASLRRWAPIALGSVDI